MKVLVIGAGGREHAIAWKLAQSPRITEVLVAPGNPGTAREPKLRNLALSAVADLVELAQREQVGFTVVGPEAPLAAGVVDAFRAAQLPIFGPTRAAAQPNTRASRSASTSVVMPARPPVAHRSWGSMPAL